MNRVSLLALAAGASCNARLFNRSPFDYIGQGQAPRRHQYRPDIQIAGGRSELSRNS